MLQCLNGMVCKVHHAIQVLKQNRILYGLTDIKQRNKNAKNPQLRMKTVTGKNIGTLLNKVCCK